MPLAEAVEGSRRRQDLGAATDRRDRGRRHARHDRGGRGRATPSPGSASTIALVSRETSLVAVDRTPARPRGARLTEEELPLNLPHGWDFDTLFNGGPADADGIRTAAQDAAELLELPQTGTDAARLMRNGGLLLLLALAGLAALRRRKPACA